MEIPKLTKDNFQIILETCLIKIPERHKFKLKCIKEGKDKKNKCGAFLIKAKSFEDKDWFVLLRKKKVSLEEVALKGVLFHELEHYFYEDYCRKNKISLSDLDERVDEYIKDRWGVEKEIKSMRKEDGNLFLSFPFGVLFAECCREQKKEWCFEENK